MNSARSIAVIVAAFAAFACGAASAQQAQAHEASPRAQEEKAGAAVQPQRKIPAPSAKDAPKSKAPLRRSVQQVIATVPAVPVAPSYGPVLGAPVASPAVAPSYGQVLANPVAPPTIAQPYGPVRVIPVAPPSYGPVLAAPSAPPAPDVAPAVPPPSAALSNCTGNLCTDSSGNTYGTGTGNAAINSQGRLCNRVGNTMQCF